MPAFTRIMIGLLLLLGTAVVGKGWVHVPGSTSSWSPQSEGSCVFAYEFYRTASITTDGSGNITNAANQCSGGSAITDATNGAIATPYLATSGPTSTGVGNFDAGVMLPGGSATTNLVATGQAFTFCFIGAIQTYRTQNVFAGLRSGADVDNLYLFYANGSHVLGFGGGPTVGATLSVTDDNASHKTCAIYNGSGFGSTSNFTFWRDGSTSASAGTTTQGGSAHSVFGNYTNGAQANFKASTYVSGFWMWNKALDSTALTNFSSYTTAAGL